MAAFTHHHWQVLCFSPFPSSQYSHIDKQVLQTKPNLVFNKSLITPSSSSSISATNSHSSPSIFLKYLQQHEQQEEEDDHHEEEEDEEEEDPLIRFFKSRATTTEDPPTERRMKLDPHRRVTWHLSPDLKSLSDPDPDPQITHSQETSINSSNPQGIVGEILQIAKTLPENSTLGEMLSEYERKVSAEDCVEVLECLAQEGLLMGCLYFFEWMRRMQDEEGYRIVTPEACSVLFPVLGRAKMGDQIMVLFRHLPRKEEFRDVHVYNSAISGLMCCARYNDAWKVYEEMEANNVRPDHVTCSIVITIMRKCGRSAKEAWDFFAKMNRKGVKWSPEVLGALIKSFCDEGLTKEALIIQIEMARKGVFSNAIIYNTIMGAFGKANRIEEAEGLFDEMKMKHIKPTSVTYNILMDAYSRRMQPKIIEKLLVEMQELGLEPNAKSYTCLISAYGRQNKMSDMAADAFWRMKKAGIKPTSHSYTALIHAYSISGWHTKAYAAFENMQTEKIKPAIETYTALLDAFRRAGDIPMLMKIWKLMRIEKVEGTRVTFNILVDGFAKQGHYVEARDVISEFGKIGLHPTVMVYNMLMNAYGRGGQESKLPQLLKEMTTLNLKPDSITYSTMIYAYVRVRDFSRAFYYHKQMVKKGEVPDAKSYEKLRSILDVKVAVKNRRDKSAILGIINSRFGRVKPKGKRKKDEFFKFKRKGPRPDNA